MMKKYILIIALLQIFVVSANIDFNIPGDDETEMDLLTPLENLIHTDNKLYRTRGLDGLPAIGIRRGVEIVVPYRIYLPQRFYRNFAIVASIKPSDHQNEYLFAILNAFDTIVNLGLLLEPAGATLTNISLIYTGTLSSDENEMDESFTRQSTVLASFVVPAFVNQWTQIAIEVNENIVTLYFRCTRFATRKVARRPLQLLMEDASKLYIANAGPILGRSFEGAIQELKLHDDPAEAANQCDEQWWKSKRRRVRPKNSDNGEGSAIFPNPTSEMVQQQEKLNYEYTQQQSTEKSSQLVTKEALTLRGPKGDRGEQGSPGVCLQQCESGLPGSPGPPGPTGPKGSQGDPGMPGIGKPGIFNDLSEKDIARIASWPGIKGEKGECITDRSDYTRYTIEGNTINTKHELKGKKGDMGIMGPPGRDGLPGQSIPPGLSGPTNSSGIYTPSNLPRANQLTTLQNDNSYKVAIGSMRIFQTTVELLAENLPAGSLAFSVSSQQLYLAVKNGWRQIMLGPFHPNVVQRPSSFIHVDSKVQTAGQDHLSYWLVQNDDEENNKNKTPLSANASNYNYKEMNGKSQANSIITNNLEIETLIKPPKDEQLSPKNIERFSHSGPILYKTTRDTSSNVPNGFNANTSIKRADHVLHLIALNELVDGNFHGIRGADLACYSEARRTGYTTTFRAFISSRVQDLNKIVHPADRHFTPVVNLHGERVANSFDSLFDDSAHSHVLLHSFNGQNIYDDSYGSIGKRSLWHGSTNKGTRALGKFCNDWRSANPEMFGMASPLMRNRALTHMAAPKSCDKKFVVLCIENMSKYESKLRFGQRI